MGHACRAPALSIFERAPIAGLDEADRRRVARAVERRDCLAVGQLAAKGFGQLYPFLTPAFENENLNTKFIVALYGTSPAVTWCLVVVQFDDWLVRYHLKTYPPFDMARDMKDRYGDPPRQANYPDQGALFALNYAFGSIAFCGDYGPAIAKVLEMANREGGMALTADEQIYLIERARLHDAIDADAYQAAVTATAKRAIAPGRRRLMRAKSRRVTLREIPDANGFWPGTCREIATLDRPLEEGGNK